MDCLSGLSGIYDMYRTLQYFSFLKKTLIFVSIVFLYCLLFILFYNLLKENNIYPYESNHEMIVNFAYNYFPIMAIFAFNGLNIFKWKKWPYLEQIWFLTIFYLFLLLIIK